MRNFSASEKKTIDKGIEEAFAFVRDILDDPATLDKLPAKATLQLTPIEQKEPGYRYTTETRQFAISATERAGDRTNPGKRSA